jgi:arylsulfatase A-like enzyme
MKLRNILFFCTDQQRKDSLGCYGHPSAATPNIDALAAGGLRFEQNIVAHPICMPSRLSMMTGMHPRNHGLWTNGLLVDPLPLTLPEHLRRQGFATASIGKIHFQPTGGDERSWESRKRWPDGCDAYANTGPYAGFEHVELTLGHGAQVVGHWGAWFRQRGGTDEMRELIRDPDVPESSGVRPMPVELHPTMFVAERGAELIRGLAAQDRPFFVSISFPDPHHPFDPPAEAAEGIEPADQPPPIGGPEDLATRPAHYMLRHEHAWGRRGRIDPPPVPGGISLEQTAILRARTTAMVNLIDRGVGRILTELDDAGIRDETLIVFTSDHGDYLGDHGIWGKGPFCYRSVINTPLIVSGPGVDSGVSTKLLSDVDLAPTFCEAAGVEPLPFADGVSQWAHCCDADQPTRETALIEHRNGHGDADVASAMLVTEDATYVRYQDGQEELSDLAADPQEHRNHASEQPDRCRALRTRLLDKMLATQSRGPEQISNA